MQKQLNGRAVIKSILEDIPSKPGIYKMLDAEGNIIYVGKAKNLKKRLANYIKPDLSGKTAGMVSLVRGVDYVICASDTESLIIEAQLIKKFWPKFNILLKDDKSFPYIKLRLDHEYPQPVKCRGKNLNSANSKEARFFGPFASSQHVDTTLNELQKIFKLRPCSDNYFAGRSRPCLQYQIKRCYGPCVGKISKEHYSELVEQVYQFLSGKSKELQEQLAQKMEIFSKNMQYEQAAEIRDRIKALSYIQSKSGSAGTKIRDADVVVIVGNSPVIAREHSDRGNPEKNLRPFNFTGSPRTPTLEASAARDDEYCIQVFLYRAGQSWGNKAYFLNGGESEQEVLESFLIQFYQDKVPPPEIIINIPFPQSKLVAETLGRIHNTPVRITHALKGDKAKPLQNAVANAHLSLEQRQKQSIKNRQILQEVKILFSLPNIPERIEVYDNSHIMGAFAVGGMVVATPEGFNKKEYRLFTIKKEDAKLSGDDFAMLKEVLTRRLSRLKQEPLRTPGLMIIDGGKGHMSTVKKVMQESGFNIPFVCMAKGANRNAGEEHFHMPGKEPFTLDKNKPLMKYLQILRDEVHNFVIRSHRKKRSKAIKTSSLDNIRSIGLVRKKALLGYFGSYRAISEASIDELAKVKTINKKVAQSIFEALH